MTAQNRVCPGPTLTVSATAEVVEQGVHDDSPKLIRSGKRMAIKSSYAHSLARSLVRGVTWKHPLVSLVVHAADPLDFMIRGAHGRLDLPAYSIRVRSNGVRQDLGGGGFVGVGRRVTALLRSYAQLRTDSKTLEIGCGCGRNAIALAEFLNDGNYTGMDVERVAFSAARRNSRLAKKRFAFDFLDVRNDVYNPDGKYSAGNYVLPYPEESFDVVFMISVYTHMLTDEVLNYSREISRVLRPDGRCFVTAYLLDREMTRQFPFRSQQHSFADEMYPGTAVAYKADFLSSAFTRNGMSLSVGPLWGTIHGGTSETDLDQDLMVFTKEQTS